jgi:hypothetical protein
MASGGDMDGSAIVVFIFGLLLRRAAKQVAAAWRAATTIIEWTCRVKNIVTRSSARAVPACPFAPIAQSQKAEEWGRG